MVAESEKRMAWRCANHPDTETYLRCSRCGKPICPRCVIPTPVGGRCRECAALQKPIMFQVTPYLYARAIAVGLVVAVAGGVLWAELSRSVRFFDWILMALLGYVVGEAVSRGARGRISRGLMIAAGVLTVLGVLAGRAAMVFARLPGNVPIPARLEAAFSFALGDLFSSLIGLLLVGLAVVIAASRIR